MIITNDFITKGRGEGGGWSREQFHLLGVAWPPRKGWKKRCLGKFILDYHAAQFIAIGQGRTGGGGSLSVTDEPGRLPAQFTWVDMEADL